jgi:hypothetical protein
MTDVAELSRTARSRIEERRVEKRRPASPHLSEALLKAQGYARLARLAKDNQKRAHYQRMHRKWAMMAQGWFFIVCSFEGYK